MGVPGLGNNGFVRDVTFVLLVRSIVVVANKAISLTLWSLT